jgi:hypothetical protein
VVAVELVVTHRPQVVTLVLILVVAAVELLTTLVQTEVALVVLALLL